MNRELEKSKHGPNSSTFYNGFDQGWKSAKIDAMNSEAVKGLFFLADQYQKMVCGYHCTVNYHIQRCKDMTEKIEAFKKAKADLNE